MATSLPSRRLAGPSGQALPLVVGIVALAALGVVALGRFAAATVDAARARTAADAAALAGASDGRAAAVAVAAANGGSLVSFAARDETVIVEVRVGDALAGARATLTLAQPP
jgi:hypothetical protein